MKTSRSIQQLAQEIDRQREMKRDYIMSTNALQMRTDNDASRLVFNVGGALQQPIVSALAHDQLGQFLDIPAKFYDRLHTRFPELLDHNVTTLLHATDAKRMVRTLDGRARAFLSDRYRRMDNYQLLAAIVPTFAERGDLQYASLEVTESRLYVKVITDELTAEVRKGDVVRGGVCVRNSEVGLGRLSVEPFIERLVCTNGMTVTQYGMKRNHAGKRIGADVEDAEELFSDETLQADDTAFFLKVRDLVKATLTQDLFSRIVDDMKVAAKETIVGDVPAVVEVLADRYSLRDAERQAVLRNIIDGGDLSRWGALNAVTRVANDAPDYDRASELEIIGGKMLTMPGREWHDIATTQAA